MFCSFFERIKDTIICFRDFLTFKYSSKKVYQFSPIFYISKQLNLIYVSGAAMNKLATVFSVLEHGVILAKTCYYSKN